MEYYLTPSVSLELLVACMLDFYKGSSFSESVKNQFRGFEGSRLKNLVLIVGALENNSPITVTTFNQEDTAAQNSQKNQLSLTEPSN